MSVGNCVSPTRLCCEVQRARDERVTVQARLTADNATLTEQLAIVDSTRQTLVAEERALRHTLAEQDGRVQCLQVRLDVQASLYGDLQRRLDGLGVPSAPDHEAT